MIWQMWHIEANIIDGSFMYHTFQEKIFVIRFCCQHFLFSFGLKKKNDLKIIIPWHSIPQCPTSIIINIHSYTTICSHCIYNWNFSNRIKKWIKQYNPLLVPTDTNNQKWIKQWYLLWWYKHNVWNTYLYSIIMAKLSVIKYIYNYIY